MRQTVEAVYRAALTEFERLKRLGPDFVGHDKQMTTDEARYYLRLVRYLQATALRQEGKTLAEIGLLFGVSRQRVNQLLKPPAEYKRAGRPRRAGTPPHSPQEREIVLTRPAHRYRLQVRDKFTYLDDGFEIDLLVHSLLDDSKRLGGLAVNDSNSVAGPVSLSDVSITLEPVDPKAMEHVWYSGRRGAGPASSLGVDNPQCYRKRLE